MSDQQSAPREFAFAANVPQYCAAGPSLVCAATVDGLPATYEITAEALEDHFAARCCLRDDLVAAYERHRDEIERVARDLFDMTGAKHVVLHSGHFRFAP